MTNITSLAWDVGAHTEFGGSVYNSLKISIDNGMYATQFFLGSPYSLVRNKPTTLDIENSKKLLSRFPLHVFSHFLLCRLNIGHTISPPLYKIY